MCKYVIIEKETLNSTCLTYWTNDNNVLLMIQMKVDQVEMDFFRWILIIHDMLLVLKI